ncbi:S1 RNA-binding domain-containing protein [Peribacillus sp. CSMR9]|uniref:CvfB family protein n=1 Tax=Peribacillus sp. CSMR9 TaxID=2981350 RepID=UPI002953BCDE|nr:S1-like domain-containing RNA-binding protein [Peribacillus sp. CSMR9]MDV7763626.1 S1-like domain-containing RNA-binding protein [Peribacillus sp. CSMR9]
MQKIQAGLAVELEVERKADFGWFLTDGSEDVLLHHSEMKEGTELELGDEVTVFIYHDKQARLTATMKIPEIQIDQYGWAEVVNVKRKLGVFVNIGLSKDILVSLDDLPNIDRLWPEVGDRLYVSLKTDRNDRLFGKLATEDVIQEIAVKAPLKGVRNTTVKGNVYRLLMVGSFFVSEEGYRCFIHESERKEEPRLGELVEGRVIDSKEDGTLNVSLFPFKQDLMGEDADVIFTYLMNRGGAMPYGDKTPPDDIQFHFGLSKGAFKRALGKLMKEEKIYQEDGWTYSSDRK